MKPAEIIERFGLKNPIFRNTAAYGHMGRACYSKPVEIKIIEEEIIGDTEIRKSRKVSKEVKFFEWENLEGFF